MSFWTRYSLLGTLIASCAVGCGSIGTRLHGWEGLTDSDRITVLPLRDHVSDDPEDSINTGRIAQDAIVTAFMKHLRGEVDSFIPDEYDSSMGFDAVRAVSIGRDRGSGYVLIGNCIEFYRVAPMTYRVDRGGIEVQIVRVSDGQRVFQASEIRNTGTNFSTPKDAIASIAADMAKGARGVR